MVLLLFVMHRNLIKTCMLKHSCDFVLVHVSDISEVRLSKQGFLGNGAKLEILETNGGL